MADVMQAARQYSRYEIRLPQDNLEVSATAATVGLAGWQCGCSRRHVPSVLRKTRNTGHLTGCSTAGMVCLRLAWIAQTREAAILHLQDAVVHFRDALEFLQRSAGPAQVPRLQSDPAANWRTWFSTP